MQFLWLPVGGNESIVLLTNIGPSSGSSPGPAPSVQAQADDGRHAGDLLPSSPAVLVEDVDLLGFKGQRGLDANHAAGPDDDGGSQCSHGELHQPVTVDVQHAVKTLAKVAQTWRGAGRRQPLGEGVEVFGGGRGRRKGSKEGVKGRVRRGSFI